MVGSSTTVQTATSVLEGVLERVVFHNDESAWTVVRLEVAGKPHPVTVVGNLLGVQPGESLRLAGAWVDNKKYGRQFQVSSFATVHPATLTGMERYLGSGMIRGVGSTMAKRLVEHFGLETLEVIDTAPARLTEVDGIGPVRSEKIREAWQEQRDIKDVMLFLQSHGISTTYAVKIYKRYGKRAIAEVRANPYRLAAEIHGIGFKTADQIAASLGIERSSPDRAAAGVIYVLGEISDEGHVYCPRRSLVERANAILEIEESIVDEAITRLDGQGRVVVEGVGEDAPIFLTALHACEAGCAQLLEELLAAPASPIAIDVERALAWVEREQRVRLAAQQREAIRKAAASKVLVITGGPGTGKTTITNAIIRILERKGRRISLCAPTGRAAKRLAEATGEDARTIHRLLEFSPKSGQFQRNQETPLAADLLIVDEMSMVDTVLFYHLLRAVTAPCQLVLIGDADQLPSVGPGNVLADVMRSGRVETVRLTEIFRQAQQSRIVVNAHRVNRGELPSWSSSPDDDFFFVEKETPEEILTTVKDLVARRLPAAYKVEPKADIQVLTPMHRGILGAANLNAELQELLTPRVAAATRGGRSFRIGDKVMQIRNNYELDVFNGDIGEVRSVDAIERQLVACFDGRDVEYDTRDLDELVLAYACSIHKAQGNEFPVVVLPLHTQHYVMLQRNLFYTALTRGKRLVVVVGTRRALAIAVKNNETENRMTRLAWRLVQGRRVPGRCRSTATPTG